jgi:ABC-type methionine transport system ATPase subunit
VAEFFPAPARGYPKQKDWLVYQQFNLLASHRLENVELPLFTRASRSQAAGDREWRARARGLQTA